MLVIVHVYAIKYITLSLYCTLLYTHLHRIYIVGVPVTGVSFDPSGLYLAAATSEGDILTYAVKEWSVVSVSGLLYCDILTYEMLVYVC